VKLTIRLTVEIKKACRYIPTDGYFIACTVTNLPYRLDNATQVPYTYLNNDFVIYTA